jgi:hypothetical protein
MTDETTALKDRCQAKAAATYHSSPWGSAVLDGGLLSWLGGIGLNKGFGVSVPFIAGWILAGGLILLTFTVADSVAAAYHKQAIKAAPHIAAADVLGKAAAQEVLDATGLMTMDKKIKDMSAKVDGGYL